MAEQLIGDMTGPWKSDDYSEKFNDAILALVSKKVQAGETATVTTLDDAPAEAGANNVVDLTDLLESLAKRKPGGSVEAGTRSTAGSAKKSAAKTST